LPREVVRIKKVQRTELLFLNGRSDKRRFNNLTFVAILLLHPKSYWSIPNYPMSESSIRRNLQKQAKKQKMRYLHPHAWRHSCASFLVNKLDCDIYQVKERLGHSDIVITSKIYVQLFPERKDKITKKMNQLNIKK